jgi:nicotinamidase-related amidase
VKASALGGLDAGLQVLAVGDGMRAVNVQPHDGEEALVAMRHAGVTVV